MDDLLRYDANSNGTKGLVFIGQKILVYRRDTKTTKYPLCIDLPGGGAEPNETPFQTYKREVMEEFGLEIKPEQVVYCKKYPSQIDPSQNTYFPVVLLDKSQEKNIKFGKEGSEYMLMDLKDFLELDDLAWPYMKDRVTDYLQSKKAQ